MRPVRGLLHAAHCPLFLDGARPGSLAGAEVVAGSEDDLQAGHGVGDVPLIGGHDHGFPLQQTADHALGAPGQQRHVEPDAFLLGGRDELAEGHARFHHGYTPRPVDEHDLLHLAQVDHDGATGARHGVAPEVRGAGAHRHQRGEGLVRRGDQPLDLVGAVGFHHVRRLGLVDEAHVFRVRVQRCCIVADVRTPHYLDQLFFTDHRLFLASFAVTVHRSGCRR